MASAISYANIAANASSSESSPVEQGPKLAPESPSAKPSSPEVDSESSASPTSQQKQKKPEPTQKKLAPAPVPATNAWGTSPSVAGSVDEHRWPTPKQDTTVKPKQPQQKFIKPITNKWVPMDAKLILPNDRNPQQPSTKKSPKKNKKNKKKSKDSKDTKDPRELQPKEKDVDSKDSSDDLPASVSAETSSAPAEAQGQPAQANVSSGASTSPGASIAGPNYKKYPIPVQNGAYYAPPMQQMQQQAFPPNYQYPRQFRVPNQYRSGAMKGFNGAAFPNGYAAYPGGYVNGYAANGFLPQMPIPQYQIPIPQPQQIPPPISPKQDPSHALVQQIDYYFSLENLIKDIFLRKNMKKEGWVDLSLILNFKRVKIILNNIQNALDQPDLLDALILDSIKECTNIEFNFKKGDDSEIGDVQLRVKENYQQWILEN